MKFIFNYSLIVITSFFIANTSVAGNDKGLHIHDPWIREAPPNATMLAAYMVLENHADKKMIITKITSPVFNKIEIHTSVMKNNMATMEQRNRLVIHAGKRFILQPGEYHLMLMKPTKQLKHGDEVTLTFTLENGSTLNSKAKVKKVIGSMRSGNSRSPATGSAPDMKHNHDHEHKH